MLKKNISNHRVILLAIMLFIMSFAVNPIMFAKALVEEDVYTNPVPPGYTLIDFEDGTDWADMSNHYPGLLFTSAPNTYWMWVDIRVYDHGAAGHWYWTARSLTEPYNYGDWVMNGFIAAYTYGQWGRIDFTDRPVNYFSVLVCTYSGVQVDAYDSDGLFLATSGWASGNLYDYTFTRLTIEAEGIAYVIMHDSAQLWWIDDIVFGRGIEATIEFNPDTLNQKSKGKWVTVYITIEGYDLNDIDVDTVKLNGVLDLAVDSPTEVSDDGILMVKFDREAVIEKLEPGEEVEISVSGELGDGTPFEGTNIISVIH